MVHAPGTAGAAKKPLHSRALRYSRLPFGREIQGVDELEQIAASDPELGAHVRYFSVGALPAWCGYLECHNSSPGSLRKGIGYQERIATDLFEANLVERAVAAATRWGSASSARTRARLTSSPFSQSTGPPLPLVISSYCSRGTFTLPSAPIC